MTRQHRRWHIWLWLVLGPLLALGLLLALAARPAHGAALPPSTKEVIP